jgi:hypothetical protein
VFVPLTRLSMPWARRPSSLANERVQSALVCSFFIKCRYSCAKPVSGSMTACAKCGIGLVAAGGKRGTFGGIVATWLALCARVGYRGWLACARVTLGDGCVGTLGDVGAGTLNDVGVGTLGDGCACTLGAGCTCTLGDAAAGWAFGKAEWKIWARCRSAWSRSLPMLAKGVAGAGFWRAWMSSCAAMMAASADDVLGILL